MKSHVVINEIKKLNESGHKIKKISLILGVSKNTVRRYLRRPKEAETESAVDLGATTPKAQILGWQKKIDWEGICLKRQQGRTAKQLYADYAPEVSYGRFCAHLKNARPAPVEVAVRLHHNPGEKVQVDFSDGIPITDPKTGKQTKTQLFVGVLPFSSYCFGVFVENQKLETFIRAHEGMWSYFQGVAPYVVIDNLKSGVHKAHRYDPELNPTYCDYANRRQFAVLPARPYTPRDKAAVESNIGAIQRSFFESVKDLKFYSLQDLNAHFFKFLEEFNNKIMSDYGVSRFERFQFEREKLLPVALEPYEMCEWRQVKVHPDCCIQVFKSFYSVPYRYCGQTVRVKITEGLISIFNQDVQSIACHQRARRPGAVVTCEEHFPERSQQAHCFDVRKALAKAESVGPKTSQMVTELLSGSRPLRYLRRVQGIFRILDTEISVEALEYASSQAITFSKMQLSFIKSCALQYKATGGNLQSTCPQRDLDTVHLRGGYNV